MAFTRSFLNATGLTEEQVKAVMEEHVSVTDALKADRDKFKAEAEKAADLQKQIDAMNSGEDWKKKFEDEKKAFDDFKAKTAQDAEAAKVRAAYRKLLIEEKIGEKWLDRVMDSTDFSGMKLDKDGNLNDSDKLKESLDKKWGDVKTTVTEKGANVERPPHVGKATKTKDEILAIKDRNERLQAIAENHEQFGF
jgi:hypothetical protein